MIDLLIVDIQNELCFSVFVPIKSSTGLNYWKRGEMPPLPRSREGNENSRWPLGWKSQPGKVS